MSIFLRAFRIAAAVSLLASTALFVLWSRHWPLVGDASLIHYIAFLIQHGMAPYRDLGDMNMPGSFLLEMAAMKVFGGGASGWRLFDFTLLAVAAASFITLTRRAGWFAAIFAACLFALVHGRDGLAQGGQRDLSMAVLLVAATAMLFVAVTRRAWWAIAAFGFLAGIALTIKPTALPLSLAQLVIAAWVMRKPSPASQNYDTRHPVLHPFWTLFWAASAMLIGPAIAFAFLLRQHALTAFWGGLHGIVPYYASLGHRPLGYLLVHSISPLMALVLLWLAVLVLRPSRPAATFDWERGLLLCGVGFGLLSYVVQARGLPYYRYPLLAFLLPLMARDLVEAMGLLRSSLLRTKAAAILAIAALAVGSLFLAPQSAMLIHRYRWWQTDFISSLEQNLQRLGGAQLSGHVQCVDSISGCGTALYDLRLMPATGVLSDFLLFGPPEIPVIAATRKTFEEGVFAHPPQVIVVSSWLHIDGPGEYRKLARWPALQRFLAERYRLDTEWTPKRMQRWWSREELGPGYRIYTLTPSQTRP